MEKFDLYDKDRQLTPFTMERGKPVPDDLYRTVVHIALFNSEGKMLIQKRQKNKSSWADLWDFTVGGHVTAGETSRHGAQRELEEELGLKVDFSGLRPSFTVNFQTGFDDFYIISRDVDIAELTLQEEEVQSVRWADMAQILSMTDSGEFIRYKKSLICMLFEMKDSTGVHLS